MAPSRNRRGTVTSGEAEPGLPSPCKQLGLISSPFDSSFRSPPRESWPPSRRNRSVSCSCGAGASRSSRATGRSRSATTTYARWSSSSRRSATSRPRACAPASRGRRSRSWSRFATGRCASSPPTAAAARSTSRSSAASRPMSPPTRWTSGGARSSSTSSRPRASPASSAGASARPTCSTPAATSCAIAAGTARATARAPRASTTSTARRRSSCRRPTARSPRSVVFTRLDLGEDPTTEARALFASLGNRKQALSPDDRDALLTILREHGARVLGWLPAAIPVRENVALVFGTLFQSCDPGEVLPHAQRFMTTATDVLRFVAVLSGTDGSLQPETVFRRVEATLERPITAPVHVRRFKTAKLPRPLRRALLAILEGMDPDRLVEDMLRHRSTWVWVGEFLHPHEYAKRFPNVARAFQVVRGKAPDGSPAPPFHGFHARVVRAERAGIRAPCSTCSPRAPASSGAASTTCCASRRTTRRGTGSAPRSRARSGSSRRRPSCSRCAATSPARVAKQAARVYWPKGPVAIGVGAPDARPLLGPGAIEPAVRAIEAELLRRFGALPAFPLGLVDDAALATSSRPSTSGRRAARRCRFRAARASRWRRASSCASSCTGVSPSAAARRRTSTCPWPSTTRRGNTPACAPTTSSGRRPGRLAPRAERRRPARRAVAGRRHRARGPPP